jgi:hypothetical protein
MSPRLLRLAQASFVLTVQPPPERDRRVHALLLAVVSLLSLGAAVSACSGHKAPEGSEQAALDDVPECVAYFTALEGCLEHLTPDRADVTGSRVADARRAMASLPIDAAKRQCAQGTPQLQTSCR